MAGSAGKRNDTDTILAQLTKMKEEIIADRVEKDQEILDKLDQFNEEIQASIQSHGERISVLEGAKINQDGEIEKLRSAFDKLRDDHNSLSNLFIDSVQHSRRLNLDFMSFPEAPVGQEEDVISKLQQFFREVLQIPGARVDEILFRACHRLGRPDRSKPYPRIIKAGFVRMSDRDLVLSLAYKCKDTPFSIRVDVCPQIAPLRKMNLDTRKRILEVNPTALASCTYRNVNHPELLVKFKGKVQQWNSATMDMASLEKGDKKPRE